MGWRAGWSDVRAGRHPDSVCAVQRPFNSFSDYLIEAILVVAFTLAVVAVAGLHALQRGRYGRLGAAGSLMTFLGYTLTATVTAVTVLLGSEALYSVRFIGGLAVLIGSILLGAMTLRAGSVMVVRCAAHRRLPPRRRRGHDHWRGERGDSVGVLWGLVGYALLSSARAPDQQPVRVSRASPGSGIW
jgi:hypothetical protein